MAEPQKASPEAIQAQRQRVHAQHGEVHVKILRTTGRTLSEVGQGQLYTPCDPRPSSYVDMNVLLGDAKHSPGLISCEKCAKWLDERI